MTDKRITGEANALATLHHLHRFGWLTSRMLSALHWKEYEQGDAMARRTLRRLLDEKLVLRRQADGNDVWLLSVAGARRLREQLGIEATSGQGLKLANSLHRACSNWYLIQKIEAGFDVWTEYEIQTGRAPWGKMDGKAADGLLDSGQGVIWVEVENAWKNRARRQEVAMFCRRHLSHEDGHMTDMGKGHNLARMHVVGTNADALRMMRQTFLEAYKNGEVRDAHLVNVDFSLLPVTASLAAGAGQTWNLWYDLIKPLTDAPSAPPPDPHPDNASNEGKSPIPA